VNCRITTCNRRKSEKPRRPSPGRTLSPRIASTAASCFQDTRWTCEGKKCGINASVLTMQPSSAILPKRTAKSAVFAEGMSESRIHTICAVQVQLGKTCTLAECLSCTHTTGRRDKTLPTLEQSTLTSKLQWPSPALAHERNASRCGAIRRDRVSPRMPEDAAGACTSSI